MKCIINLVAMAAIAFSSTAWADCSRELGSQAYLECLAAQQQGDEKVVKAINEESEATASGKTAVDKPMEDPDC